jgi:hypothetical protein
VCACWLIFVIEGKGESWNNNGKLTNNGRRMVNQCFSGWSARYQSCCYCFTVAWVTHFLLFHMNQYYFFRLRWKLLISYNGFSRLNFYRWLSDISFWQESKTHTNASYNINNTHDTFLNRWPTPTGVCRQILCCENHAHIYF